MVSKIAKTRTIAIIAAVVCLLILVVLETFIYMNTSEGNDCYIGGKKLIAVGSEQFKPDIEPYALCLVQEVTDDSQKSIEKGDIVIYSQDLNGIRAKVCCKVLDEKPGDRLFVGSGTGNWQSEIALSEVDSKVIKAYNNTAGFSKILLNQTGIISVFIFIALVVLYAGVAIVCHIIAKP